MKRIAILGYTGSGKTTAGRYALKAMGYRKVINWDCTIEPANISDVLISEMGDEAGIEALWIDYCKPLLRQQLYWLGRGIELVDPLWLIRKCLERSPVVCGIRTERELAASVHEANLVDAKRALFDQYWWIERGVKGETDGLTCDDVERITRGHGFVWIKNNGTLEQLRWAVEAALKGI